MSGERKTFFIGGGLMKQWPRLLSMELVELQAFYMEILPGQRMLYLKHRFISKISAILQPLGPWIVTSVRVNLLCLSGFAGLRKAFPGLPTSFLMLW